MPKLFVDKTIEIDAPSFKAWDVLTKPEFTSQWAREFAGGAPFRIESDWRMGAAVLWKNEKDEVVVEGHVTGFEPEKLLRYTVSDVRNPERLPVAEEDGIAFELIRQKAHILLHVRQGDFSVMKDGQRYQQASEEVWDRVLPKIKQLAEGAVQAF